MARPLFSSPPASVEKIISLARGNPRYKVFHPSDIDFLMASTITVKSDLQGDKRRFQLDVRGGFDALRLAVETAYGECNLLIK